MAVHSHHSPGLCMKPRRCPHGTFDSFFFIDKPQNERALTSFTESYTSIHARLRVTMSGAETVIGLVLGVLPLFVSTAEHYDNVFRPFKRYKRFSKELKKFQ